MTRKLCKDPSPGLILTVDDSRFNLFNETECVNTYSLEEIGDTISCIMFYKE